MQTAPRPAITGPVGAEERQQITDLYRSGTKVAEICRLTGRSRSSVYMVVNDSGAEHRNAAAGQALRPHVKSAEHRLGMCRQVVARTSPE